MALLLAGCTPMAKMQGICKGCQTWSFATPLSPIFGWARLHNSQETDPAQALHIYIENDGAAFIAPNQIAANPSLRAKLLALRLMQLDNNPSLYLTRPCYGFALNALPATCHPHYWTQARYSQEVVASLSQAIDQAKQALKQTSRPLVLIGHSGGGNLALLIAHRRRDVQKVVTLAANLDTDAWARHHRYTPLDQSLNPFNQPLLAKDVQRWHFAGADDRAVPPHLITPSCQRDSQAHCQILPGVAHETGWLEHWPKLIAQFTSNSPAP